MGVRSKINKINELNYHEDSLERKVVFDGKQFGIRIPKEFSDFLEIKKGDKFLFILKIADENKNKKESQLTAKYVRVNDKKK